LSLFRYGAPYLQVSDHHGTLTHSLSHPPGHERRYTRRNNQNYSIVIAHVRQMQWLSNQMAFYSNGNVIRTVYETLVSNISKMSSPSHFPNLSDHQLETLRRTSQVGIENIHWQIIQRQSSAPSRSSRCWTYRVHPKVWLS